MTGSYFLGMYNEAMTYVYFNLFKPELWQMKVFLVNIFVYHKVVSKNNRKYNICLKPSRSHETNIKN